MRTDEDPGMEMEIEWFDRASMVRLFEERDELALDGPWCPTQFASFTSWRLARGWSSDDD